MSRNARNQVSLITPPQIAAPDLALTPLSAFEDRLLYAQMLVDSQDLAASAAEYITFETIHFKATTMVGIKELQGAIINPQQAISLIQSLGIVISNEEQHD